MSSNTALNAFMHAEALPRNFKDGVE